MDTIQDRNGMDPTKAEILRWQEYTEELYEKDVNDPDNSSGVITTHLEAGILEWEVKWPLWIIAMNEASGGEVIQQSYFKS